MPATNTNITITPRAVYASSITLIACWTLAYLAIEVFRDYAFGLFVWLPFMLGGCATMIYSYKRPAPRKAARNISYWTMLLFCLGLLVFAWEGIICLIMAAPIGLLFTYIGHRMGYAFVRDAINGTPAAIILLFLSAPAFMAFEHTLKDNEELRAVVTAIEISASPQEVWENVIAFPQLSEPTEFIFKTGIAYPVNATIAGSGVGAIRHCNFSTGSFIEPITVWNEPILLRFSVTSQPEPMRELSMYDIHPNHLHGYWASKKGQFKLIPLANGRTRLEGTTWYVNKIKPGIYWTLWSDHIVHSIHNRVLAHIKKVTEAQAL
ncbi:MAG: hypothetical protein V4649_11385 [Bacteroidota bacterium]